MLVKPLARVAPKMAFSNLSTAQVTPSGNAGAVTRQGTGSGLGILLGKGGKVMEKDRQLVTEKDRLEALESGEVGTHTITLHDASEAIFMGLRAYAGIIEELVFSGHLDPATKLDHILVITKPFFDGLEQEACRKFDFARKHIGTIQLTEVNKDESRNRFGPGELLGGRFVPAEAEKGGME